MNRPDPSAQPDPSTDPQTTDHPEAVDGETVESEAPLNRAARRAKANRSDPSHVGPRPGTTPSTRGPRSHTKRQIG